MARRLEPTVFLAMISPITVGLVAATMALVLLAGGGWALAFVVGVAVWVLRVALSLLVARRIQRLEPRIDPFALREPWRFFVRDALTVRNRLREALDTATPGPLRDRLEEIGARVETGVTACWEVARRGQHLTDARRRIDIAEIDRTIETTEPEDPRHRSARSQRESHDRLATREEETRDRLERLDAQLDEAVVRAAELATRTGATGEIDDVAARVDTVVDELDSLRIALDELGAGS